MTKHHPNPRQRHEVAPRGTRNVSPTWVVPKRSGKGQSIAAYIVIFFIIAVAIYALWGIFWTQPQVKPRLELVNGKPCGAYVLLHGKYLPANALVNIRYTFYRTTRFNVPAAGYFASDQTLYTDADGQFIALIDPIAKMNEIKAKEIFYITQLQADATSLGVPLGMGRTTAQSQELYLISMPGSSRPDIDEGAVAPAGPAATDPWHATYFRDRDLFAAINTGEIYTQAALWFPDGLVQSVAGVPLNPTSHSASFTRTVDFAGPANLQLMLMADDGAQIYHSEDGINWGAVVDAKTSDGQFKTVDLPVRLGKHYFKVNYFESGGTARLCFTWREHYAGWQARYYTDTQLNGNPHMILDDRQIDFNWKEHAPTQLPAGHAVQAGNYSVSWERLLKLSGQYEFKLETDQYARVYIDGQLISTLSRWPTDNIGNVPGTAPALNATQVCRLQEGEHRITVHYRNTGNPAHIKFDILALNATKQPDGGQPLTCP